MGNGLETSDIFSYVIAAICLMMLFKWIKKCWTRRQQRQEWMMQQMEPIQQVQMQPIQQPLQNIQQLAALAAPVVHPTYRNQFRPAMIYVPEIEIEDSMQKYRT